MQKAEKTVHPTSTQGGGRRSQAQGKRSPEVAQLKARIAGLPGQLQALALRPEAPVPPPTSDMLTTPNQVAQLQDGPDCDDGCGAACEFWNEHPEATAIGPPADTTVGQTICCGTEPCGCLVEDHLDQWGEQLREAIRRAHGDPESDQVRGFIEQALGLLTEPVVAHEASHVAQEGRVFECDAAEDEIDRSTMLNFEQYCNEHQGTEDLFGLMEVDEEKYNELVRILTDQAGLYSDPAWWPALWTAAAAIATNMANSGVDRREGARCLNQSLGRWD